MQVELDPPNNLQFFYTPTASATVPSTTDNNLALKVYDEDVYNMLPVIKALAFILACLALAVFLFGLFGSSKLMAVEMIAVLQLAYIGLIMIDKLEALVYPLLYLWPVNGYNILLPDGDTSSLPPRVSAIGYKSYFLANFSINFVIALIPFIVGGVLFAIARRK